MKELKKIHILGIGGIGTSGLARWLNAKGYEVSGSDTLQNELTSQLQAEGISIYDEKDVTPFARQDLIIRTSAVKNEHLGLRMAREQAIPILRRAEALAAIAGLGRQICIAGTHGKTTSTAMTTLILQQAGFAPTAFIGGEVKNFGGNYVQGDDHWFVLEADEYDRSFLTLQPYIAAITSIEADHLDIYEDEDDIEASFREFSQKVPFFGYLIYNAQNARCCHVAGLWKQSSLGFGLHEGAQLRATSISAEDFCSRFTVEWEGNVLGQIKLQVPGEHNILNALLSIAVGLCLKIDFSVIKKALELFKGVKRRFEKIGEKNGVLFYDDYAHHPSEIHETLKAIRQNTSCRIIAVFQPHLYTRTRDFYPEFAASLSAADLVYLLPIYPAREKPIPGIDSELIYHQFQEKYHKNIRVIEKDALFTEFAEILQAGDFVITLGAGSVTGINREFFQKWQ